MIHFTEKAAKQLQGMYAQLEDKELQLRLFVEKGGCSGLEYGMSFDVPTAEDTQLDDSGIKFVVDTKSLEKIPNITIDYDDSLNGKGFQVINPDANNTCGCGKSFN